jgi:hypothetical protein
MKAADDMPSGQEDPIMWSQVQDRHAIRGSLIIAGFALFLFMTSAKATEMTMSTPIDPIEGTISNQDIEDVFSYLGIDISKFQYSIPYPYCIKWGVITYINGKEEASNYSGRFSSPGNKLTTLTLISQRDRDSLKFFARHRTEDSAGGLSLSAAALAGGAGTWSHLANQRLGKGHRTPLFVFAQDRGGVRGINPTDSLEDIIAKYERVIVVFAELGDPDQK